MTATPLSIFPNIQPTLNLTIFAVPKPFRGQIGIIQRNAIQSWTKLKLRPEIILLGNDEGTQEIAREFGLCPFSLLFHPFLITINRFF